MDPEYDTYDDNDDEMLGEDFEEDDEDLVLIGEIVDDTDDDLVLLGDALDEMNDASNGQMLGWRPWKKAKGLFRKARRKISRAVRRPRRKRPTRRRPRPTRQREERRMSVRSPSRAGQLAQIGGREKLFGLGSHQFLNAAPTTITFRETPQISGQLIKLICTVAKSAGAIGVMATVDDIKIGTHSQLGGGMGIAASVLTPNATYELIGDRVQPGKNIEVDLSVDTAPAIGEHVWVSVVAVIKQD